MRTSDLTLPASHPAIRYTGRVDLSGEDGALLVWPASGFSFRYTGRVLEFRLRNLRHYWENSVSVFAGGREFRIALPAHPEAESFRITLPRPGTLVEFRKLQAGGSHYVEFLSLGIERGAELLPPPPAPERRIEVFGDSVSAGEVCECSEFAGMADPEDHRGRFDNALKSYAALAAGKLGAELHCTAQGGIAVMDGTGYFDGGKVGMERVWDALRYNPSLGPVTAWDFTRWVPHVVILALGQNDSHPDDFIDRDPVKRELWLSAYGRIARSLRERYPKAAFIMLTTILEHRSAWDEALDELAARLADMGVRRFRFSRGGRGTPGHPRIGEQEEMAAELAAFIESLGNGVWQGL